MANKPYTSQEIAQLVEHWQVCRFFDKKTDRTIIELPNHELFRKGSELRCDPAALEKIRAALIQAYYYEGVREVGMLCPFELRIELIDLALSITNDPAWGIFPAMEFTYIKNMLEQQESIWENTLYFAQLDEVMSRGEKQILEINGFTEQVLEELKQYVDVEDVNDLPPHLRQLFAPEAPATQEPVNELSAQELEKLLNPEGEEKTEE